MDFTIITPSYNYGHFIEECLESVARQDGISLEHLVMDAGSTDQTAEIVSRYSHARFYQESDDGMSDGINKGFRKARGKWVMWLNTDDRLKPGALAEVKRFGEAANDADVIFGCWDFVDRNGSLIRRMSVFPFRSFLIANYGCYIASTSTFFRRSTTIDEGFLLNTKFGAVMDGEFFCRLSKAGRKFRYLPCVLADFRLYSESISQRHLESKDIDGVLARQLQVAESRSIRRVYGIKLFRDEMLNGVVEGLLFQVLRVQKGWLRWWHRSSCREPGG